MRYPLNMKTRKTVNVAEMLFTANYFMKHSKPEQVGERRGTASLLESMLHASGNYSGFGYIELTNAGTNQQKLGDESRVFYYVSQNLRNDYKGVEDRKAQEGFVY
jgi:hypothetical protein